MAPGFELSEAEPLYCIKLSDWWRDTLQQYKKDNADVIVHNLADGSSVLPQAKGRQHRLIQDAHPDAPPRGFFDCTVEVSSNIEKTHPFIDRCTQVIYKSDCGDRVQNYVNLFVTDYTENANISPQQTDWCPAGLIKKVFRIEVSDSALPTAMTMEPGQFYSLKNVRIQYGSDGYVEGRIREDKMTKLDMDDLEYQPQLLALLKSGRRPFISSANFELIDLYFQAQRRVPEDSGGTNWLTLPP